MKAAISDKVNPRRTLRDSQSHEVTTDSSVSEDIVGALRGSDASPEAPMPEPRNPTDADGENTFGEVDSFPDSAQQNLLGLSLLFEPSDPQLDVIFIHSVTDGAQATWRSGEGRCSNWPLAPDPSFQKIRVRSLSYTHDWTPENVADTPFSNSDKLLIRELSAYLSVGDCSTPIMFVADNPIISLVKRAYVHWRSETEYEQLVARIQAIVFLVAAHPSSDLAATFDKLFGSMYSQNLYLDNMSPPFLQSQGIHKEFRQCVDPRLHVFYEKIETTSSLSPTSITSKCLAERSQPLGPIYDTVSQLQSSTNPKDITFRVSLAALASWLLQHPYRQLVDSSKEGWLCKPCEYMFTRVVKESNARAPPRRSVNSVFHVNIHQIITCRMCCLLLAQGVGKVYLCDGYPRRLQYSGCPAKLRYWLWEVPYYSVTVSFDMTG